MAIDIGTFLASDSFKDLVGRLIDELKSSRRWWRRSTRRSLRKRKARNDTPSLRIGIAGEALYKKGGS